MKISKYQRGKPVAPSDNTRVSRTSYPIIKLTPELLKRNRLKKLQEASERKLAVIYDTNKAKHYRNLLNSYNSNFFGAGVFGNQSRHDPTTAQGLKAIESNVDYARDNMTNVASNLLFTGVGSSFRGILPLVSKRATVGKLSSLIPYKIGLGSEAIVINNSPLTVGKVTQVGSGEMLKRNAVPNSVPVKFVGYIRDGANRFPTFVLRKVKILTEETFPKYVLKLDKAMEKSGFRRVNDPNVLYRAYTNGLIVIDDISPGNVGLNWIRQPKMIDFNIQSVPSWLDLGFTLRLGGKL